MRKAVALVLLAVLGLACCAAALIGQARPPAPREVVHTWTPETPFITTTPQN
ncbi:hypothetical protein ACQP1V_36360 [Microtetraspora malaysiensis]|uniref:hypothetical protein n=1 Tax=Microtetraspora malaysiensis TaxID=161358 RepID=UPI003D914E27